MCARASLGASFPFETMSAQASPAFSGPSLSFRGRSYPVLLPKLSDPRLHLAAVIVTLQVLGQVAFDFRLSISQILISIGVCAVLEVGIALHRQHVLMWPASAMLTGNGVAFVLRVPGTQHGDWWSLNGWYIFAGTAAFALLSKYLIKVDGRHIFNPSNIGLVVCFLLLGPAHAEPLDFWWGPMSGWLAFALIVIVGGGLAILVRLHLLVIAIGFWVSFALGVALLALTGHAMTARWHLGPITGPYFWWVLITSPEILVFMFFMITDPKTTPKSRRGRVIYSVSVGLLAALLIAPAKTEFWSKVAVLGALAIVCGARPLLERMPAIRFGRRRLAVVAAVVVVGYTGAIAAAGDRAHTPTSVAPLAHTGRLPQLAILPSKGVETVLDRPTARRIAGDLVADLQLQTTALSNRRTQALGRAAIGDELTQLTRQVGQAAGSTIDVPAARLDHMRVWLERGHGQGAAIAVASLQGTRQLTAYKDVPPTMVRRDPAVSFRETLELQLDRGRWLVAHVRSGRPVAFIAPPPETAQMRREAAAGFAGVRLTNVAAQAGLDFRQGAFRFGVSPDPAAMMGGGLCWLDYNNDGWLDLFVVNNYAESDLGHGALPTSALFRNDHGKFVNVTACAGAGLPVRGEGCVAADLNGDGYTDLYVSTASDDKLLWNNGNGTFTEGARSSGVVSFGWHSGAAVGDVNGDGRPDLFVAGYTEANGPIPGSDGRVSDEPPRGARPALPERGQRPERPRPLPRGREAGRARPAAVRPLARRGVHRPERRRAARPLRRQRRGPEPLLRQRPHAGRPRLPLRRPGPQSRPRRPERRDGDRRGRLQPRRAARPGRHQLARAGACGLPEPRHLVRERPGRLRHRVRLRTSPAGATAGST